MDKVTQRSQRASQREDGEEGGRSEWPLFWKQLALGLISVVMILGGWAGMRFVNQFDRLSDNVGEMKVAIVSLSKSQELRAELSLRNSQRIDALREEVNDIKMRIPRK